MTLAEIGASDALPVYLGIGILAVIVGTVLVLIYRHRSGRSGSHRP